MDSLLSNYTNFKYCIKSIVEHIKIDALDAEYYHEVSGDLIQYSYKSKKDLTELIDVQKNVEIKQKVSIQVNEMIKQLEDLRAKKNINIRKGNRYFVETYSLLLNYREWFNKEFESSFIKMNLSNEKPNRIIDKQLKPNVTLSNLVTHINSVGIIEGVKIQFKNIKGKNLKLLFLALQELGLLPKERMAQKFYDCCKEEFNWDIASYNAMNGYNYNEVVDKDVYNSMKEYLTTLI